MKKQRIDTGFKDNTGRSIYVGDVVETITGLRQKIVWSEHGFVMRRLDNIGGSMVIDFDREGVKIVEHD